MRKEISVALALMLLTGPFDLWAAASEQYVSAIPLSAGTGIVVPLTASSAMLESHTLGNRKYTHLKGDVGERVMDVVTGEKWSKVEPNIGTQDRRGIDGLYIRYKKGNPSGLLVAEAKYKDSPLGMTRDGPQMSNKWVSTRLAKAAGKHGAMAQEIRENGFVASKVPPPPYEPTAGEIEMPDGLRVEAWKNKQTGRWHVYPPDNVDSKGLSKQLNKIATYLQGAAEGKIDYRTAIYRVRYEGSNPFIDVIDPETKQLRQTIVGGNLPPATQTRIKQAVIDAVAEKIYNNDPSITTQTEAQRKAKAVYAQADRKGALDKLLDDFHPRPKWSPLIGLRMAAKGAALGGLLAGGIDTFFQCMRSRGSASVAIQIQARSGADL